jgi:hypothetical protein
MMLSFVLVVGFILTRKIGGGDRKRSSIHMTQNFCLARAPIISPDFPVRTGRKF